MVLFSSDNNTHWHPVTAETRQNAKYAGNWMMPAVENNEITLNKSQTTAQIQISETNGDYKQLKTL